MKPFVVLYGLFEFEVWGLEQDFFQYVRQLELYIVSVEWWIIDHYVHGLPDSPGEIVWIHIHNGKIVHTDIGGSHFSHAAVKSDFLPKIFFSFSLYILPISRTDFPAPQKSGLSGTHLYCDLWCWHGQNLGKVPWNIPLVFHQIPCSFTYILLITLQPVTLAPANYSTFLCDGVLEIMDH